MIRGNILDQLRLLHPKEVDLNLDRMQRLLFKMGNPERKLPPTIHVAGTNGKGSTIAYLSACLTAQGYKVHTYTSPHLVAFNERIRLQGNDIDDDLLTYYLKKVATINEGDPLTFFEATTAAAFAAFSETPGDILLLETGLGGRLDATNVIQNPLACIITPISYDHQDYLGQTITEIAREKAGIIKQGTKVIVAQQNYNVSQIFVDKCQQHGANLQLYGNHWSYEIAPDGQLNVTFDDRLIRCSKPGLFGNHQYSNAATSVVALESIAAEFPVSMQARNQGLQTAFWPGRLHPLKSGLLVNSLSQGQQIWIDGAHNPDGVMALETELKHWVEAKQEITLGIALLRNRNPEMFLNMLSTCAQQIILIDMEDADRFHCPLELQRIYQPFLKEKTIIISRLSELNEVLKKLFIPTPRILFTGSLYLVGALLEINQVPLQ